MRFFDLVYYAIYKFYFYYNEKHAASTASLVTAFCITMNILTVLLLLVDTTQFKDIAIKGFAIVLLVIADIFTYLRYIYFERPSLAELSSYWEHRSATFRTWLRTLIILYVVSS